jgi:hypothetical protein
MKYTNIRRVELQAMQQAGVRNQFNLLNDEGLDEEVPHRQEADIVLEQPEEREAATEEEEQEQENAGAGMRLWVCIGGGVVVLLVADSSTYVSGWSDYSFSGL